LHGERSIVHQRCGGERSAGIARLNADGSVESTATFNPGAGVTGSVYTVVLQADGKLLVGGGLTSVNGQPRSGIARLNADGTLESTNTFYPVSGTDSFGGTTPYVLSVAAQPDGKIVLVGQFASLNGQPRTNIARLNADGTLESTNTFNSGTGVSGGGNAVYAVALQPDGKIVICGNFTTVNGQPRNRIARLNPDGTVDPTFQAQANLPAGPFDCCGEVRSIAIQADHQVLLGGDFTTLGGRCATNFGRLKSDGTLDETFHPIAFAQNAQVLAIAVQNDGKILVGAQAGTNLVRLNPDGSLETTRQNFNGFDVVSISIRSDGAVLAGLGQAGAALVDPSLSFRQWYYDAGDIQATAFQHDGKALAGGFASKLVRLIGQSPLEIKTINRFDNETKLNWSAIPNRTYRAQYRNRFSTGLWKDLGTAVSGQSGSATISDTNLLQVQRFYRIELLPN